MGEVNKVSGLEFSGLFMGSYLIVVRQATKKKRISGDHKAEGKKKTRRNGLRKKRKKTAKSLKDNTIRPEFGNRLENPQEKNSEKGYDCKSTMRALSFSHLPNSPVPGRIAKKYEEEKDRKELATCEFRKSSYENRILQKEAGKSPGKGSAWA